MTAKDLMGSPDPTLVASRPLSGLSGDASVAEQKNSRGFDGKLGLAAFIAVEAQVLFGNTAPTFFVDLVTYSTPGGERLSYGNLRSFRGANGHYEAMKCAREYADKYSVPVREETVHI